MDRHTATTPLCPKLTSEHLSPPRVLAIGYDLNRSAFPSEEDAAPEICAAKLELYGRYLSVEDNNRFGGLNASSGNNRRSRAPRERHSVRRVHFAGISSAMAFSNCRTKHAVPLQLRIPLRPPGRKFRGN